MENSELPTPPVAHKESIRRVAGDLEVTDIVPEKLEDPVPVIIVPGWGETPTTHIDTTNSVANLNRRAIAIKIPRVSGSKVANGYPRAEYDKARAIIDTLNKKEIKTTDMIAHSEGAIPAIITALENPDRVRSIVFVDPAGLIGKDSAPKLAARFVSMLAKDALRIAKVPGNRKMNMLRAANETTKYFLSNPLKSVSEVKAISEADIYDWLKALRENGVNVSVIHGENDSVFPIDKVRKTANEKGLDGIVFRSVPGDHREISVNPATYTALAVHALKQLSEKAVPTGVKSA